MRYIIFALAALPLYAHGVRTQLTPVGTAVPSATSCDDASEVGLVYVRSDNPVTSPAQVYVCRQTGATSYGWHPISHFVGATAPATCAVGQLFFDSDATAGSNWFGCTAANTWTVLSGGGGGAGDVTAAAAFANDNRLIRSDGTAKGVQASGVTLDDSGNMTIPGNLTVTGFVDIGAGAPWNMTGVTDDVAPGAPASANQFTMYVDRSSGVLKIHRNGQGSADTYMTTATAVQDSQVNVKYRTHTCTFNVADPASADSGKYKCQIPVAATITYVSCHTDTGSVATVNVNKRASSTPGTSGTNAMSSSLTCSSTQSTGTITSASVTARDWLTLTTGAPTSTPTVLTVSVEYTVN